MRPRLILTLVLIVLLPLGALAWLGLRLAAQEREVTESRLEEALNGRLQDISAVVGRSVEQRETALLRILDRSSYQPAELRELVRSNPLLQSLFVLDPQGNRIHPPPEGPLTATEEEFLGRSQQVWRDKQGFFDTGGEDGANRRFGWYTWYWGNGVNLVFWVRNASGYVIGADSDRSRLLADIIAELPDTDSSDPALNLGRVALRTADGTTVYQWGAFEPEDGALPRARLDLRPPLDAWTLQYFVPPAGQEGGIGGSLLLNLVAGLGALILAMVGLAVYFYRESTRGMREAAERVSFVNQVSHELKTPLTNIRMYAELLEQDMPERDGKAGRHLDVIVAESQRLSRLIGNVLTFARQQNNRLALHAAPGNIDQCITFVLDHFRAALDSRGIEVEFDAGAGSTVVFDRDALEQILGNLVSNVEKYAASGRWLKITSRQQGDTTTITVEDRGPGIPRGQEEQVFAPFHRLSNRVADGVAGTGIGLSIARELARRHGGGLRVVASSTGACLELQLRTPSSAAEGAPS